MLHHLICLFSTLNTPDSITVAYNQIFEGFYHLMYFNFLDNSRRIISVIIFTPDRPG